MNRTPSDIAAAQAAANVALRCAWLRTNAEHTLQFDPSGQVMCAMFDFADLLEVAHRLRWFG